MSTQRVEQRARRWSGITTPAGVAQTGWTIPGVEGSPVRAHFGLNHVRIISALSVEAIDTLVRYLDRLGSRQECSPPLGEPGDRQAEAAL